MSSVITKRVKNARKQTKKAYANATPSKSKGKKSKGKKDKKLSAEEKLNRRVERDWSRALAEKAERELPQDVRDARIAKANAKAERELDREERKLLRKIKRKKAKAKAKKKAKAKRNKVKRSFRNGARRVKRGAKKAGRSLKTAGRWVRDKARAAGRGIKYAGKVLVTGAWFVLAVVLGVVGFLVALVGAVFYLVGLTLGVIAHYLAAPARAFTRRYGDKPKAKAKAKNARNKAKVDKAIDKTESVSYADDKSFELFYRESLAQNELATASYWFGRWQAAEVLGRGEEHVKAWSLLVKKFKDPALKLSRSDVRRGWNEEISNATTAVA